MIYSLYVIETGLLTGTVLNCPEPFLEMNIPETQSCILGQYDYLRQKVVHATGEVVFYQPTQPSPNHTWDIPTLAWVYIPTDEDLAREARARRDALLAASDWVTLRAYRTSSPVPPAYASYQQALADIPDQPNFPRDIIWPTPPTE